MPKAQNAFNLGESLPSMESVSQAGVSKNRPHVSDQCSRNSFCRRSIKTAARGISFLMNANDGPIDELFRVIEEWEEAEGRPFPSSLDLVEPKPRAKTGLGLAPDQNAKPALERAEETLLAKSAEASIKERHLQYGDMPADLKADHFVRILLVLLQEAYSEKEVHLTSIGYAIDRPQTSVLRYLQMLEEHDLISRGTLASDGRVTLIELTEKGFELANVLASRAIEVFSVLRF